MNLFTPLCLPHRHELPRRASSGLARAATTQLCQEQTAPEAGGVYNVQNDEWGSGAAECITSPAAATIGTPAEPGRGLRKSFEKVDMIFGVEQRGGRMCLRNY